RLGKVRRMGGEGGRDARRLVRERKVGPARRSRDGDRTRPHGPPHGRGRPVGLGRAGATAMSDAIPTLRIDIFTLFPGMFDGVFGESIIKRARAKGLIDVQVHDIRDWTYDRHRTADDTPYGGGAGMVMKAPPIVEAVEAVLGDDLEDTHIAIMSAGGRQFTQGIA